VIFPQRSSEEDLDLITVIGREEKAVAAKEHLLKLIEDLVRVTCIYTCVFISL